MSFSFAFLSGRTIYDPDFQITKENMLKKIVAVIARSRIQRGDNNFVQTDVQLQLIWEYILNELICYSN